LDGFKLKEERSELERQAARLVDAISKHGISSFLSAQLASIESRITEVDRLLVAKPPAKLPQFSDVQIRNFLR
jgi:hypothetical protein